jgi:hypothetical protein
MGASARIGIEAGEQHAETETDDRTDGEPDHG